MNKNKSKDCGLASQGVLEFQSHESCRLTFHEVLDQDKLASPPVHFNPHTTYQLQNIKQ